MAQSIFERERLVEVNRLLPDIRDFLKELMKKESLSYDIVEQCDQYIERLNAIIQPPSLPPRLGKSTLGFNDHDGEVTKTLLTKQLSDPVVRCKEYITPVKPINHGISQEYLELQRDLSRKVTLWKKKEQLINQAAPHESQLNHIESSKQDITKMAGDSNPDPHQSVIYEKIVSASTPIENDSADVVSKSEPGKVVEPPPVPERRGRSTSNFDKNMKSSSEQHIMLNSEKRVVMVHDLKDPVYSGLLRNVRANIKQWGVIMSQKLYLFNDLEKPADFVGDLRFYEVKKDPHQKNVFHVTRSDSISIILAAVNDDQYHLWYNAFQHAKILADAAVGKFGSTGEMAEYISIRDYREFEENNYEIPNHLLGNSVLNKPSSVSYVPMKGKLSSTSIEYEEMDGPLKLPVVEPPTQDEPPNKSFENEDDILSGEIISSQYVESRDYRSLPLPPLPSPSGENPPELPVRGLPSTTTTFDFGVRREKSDDEASLSDHHPAGSAQSLDSDSEYDIKKVLSSDSSSRITSPLLSRIILKRKREINFFNDDSFVMTGVLHKRKILAVWQKYYCKVKYETLFCYRNLESDEVSIEIRLPSYQLDRADEAWRNFAFKIFNEMEVHYFAAENRADLVKWLNVLAKEMNKERFQSLKDPDIVLRPPSKMLSRQDSTDESTGSEQTLDHSKQNETNDHTSDFDADNESGGSEASDIKIPIPKPLPRNFHQVSKNRRLRMEDDSTEDSDVQIQGFIFRKFQNHWSRRWCCIKDKKFFIYRHSSREIPECVIILTCAALMIPPDDGSESHSGDYYIFKLTYEVEQTVILSTKNKEDWVDWTTTIENFVGSLSEEPFAYINVPSRLHKSATIETSPVSPQDEVDEFSSFAPDAVSSPVDGNLAVSDYQVPLPATPPFPKNGTQTIGKKESELLHAYYSGYLTEYQMLANKIGKAEYFAVLTEEKLLKFYADKKASFPSFTYNALNIDCVSESGADPCVFKLIIRDENNKEMVLKSLDTSSCEEWKESMGKIHYTEIDDDNLSILQSSFPRNLDDNIHAKMFRKRSKSIERKPKNEPILLSHCRTLPHLGRLKRIAKAEEAESAKSKRFSFQKTVEPSGNSKKSISSFIRSLTVDTLGRKAKNKSFEFSNDILLKETHHGHIREVIVAADSVKHENRYCRISGKILYCYASKLDKKHVWKVHLKNAAIEDDDSDQLYRIKVTSLDDGKEYMLLLETEYEFDCWISALSGDDRLHFSNSPHHIPRSSSNSPLILKSKTFDHTSPVFQRVQGDTYSTSDGSRPTSVEDMPFLQPTKESDRNITKKKTESEEEMSISLDVSKDLSNSGTEIDGPSKFYSALGSLSSLSSSNTVSILSSTRTMSTLSERESTQSQFKTKEMIQLLSEDDIILTDNLYVVNDKDTSTGRSLSKLILRKSVLDIYEYEGAKYPHKTIKLKYSSVLTYDKVDVTSRFMIQLRDINGSLTQFICPDEKLYNLWVSQVKTAIKSCRRKSSAIPIVGEIIRRRDRVKLIKSEDDKRKSLLLVAEDYQAVEKYEESADLSKTISGSLLEYVEEEKNVFRKNRNCWIKDGFFYVAKDKKSSKVIKKIDLSTVVILDESDPLTNTYAFRLNYTMDNIDQTLLLKAPNQSAADKWMVSVSMGILLHRLKSPQVCPSFEREISEDKIHEFVTLPPSVAHTVTTPTNAQGADVFDLGINIKREIHRKMNAGDNNLLDVSKLLSAEFPTPNDFPSSMRRECPTLGKPIEKVIAGGETEIEAKGDSFGVSMERFDILPLEEDSVFSDNMESLDMLENIPDRDKADERFKNVKGILKQQESIRRAIIHRQKSNASLQNKKIPPKVKPKPKVNCNNYLGKSQISFVALKENLTGLSMAHLQQYEEELKNEKNVIFESIKRNIMPNDRTFCCAPSSVLENDSIIEKSENKVTMLIPTNLTTKDLSVAQDRIQIIERELEYVSSQIMRILTKKYSTNKNDLIDDSRFKTFGSSDCILRLGSQSSTFEKGYDSEPLRIKINKTWISSGSSSSNESVVV